MSVAEEETDLLGIEEVHLTKLDPWPLDKLGGILVHESPGPGMLEHLLEHNEEVDDCLR
ncbi:MAG: hypothetical protein ABIJ61_06425 [bacterium]